ncbi:MAG: cyclopropane-fatty-acyl-phospholipid synthase family protein [Deltaproteobacteria bacterium]|nr:cyclopropane-fatty-acyl-phospholipid synthase family protein [Deltaproteobacteria bacterium]
MKESLLGQNPSLIELAAPAWIHRGARGMVLRLLRHLKVGTLTLVDGKDSFRYEGNEEPDAIQVTFRVHDPRFYAKATLGGTIGTGEAFMEGLWSCDDIPALVHLILRNRSMFRELESLWMLLSEPFQKFLHHLRRNTRKGSKENIAAHYDLSNDFFALWLDETMTYSCGIFDRPETKLREAQVAKIDQHYGCRVTTTTISAQQHEFASQRIREAGLGKRIRLLREDYRELKGEYDKLVSVEMIEAVGHQYYEDFFRTCGRLLKPEGQMLLQTITIEDAAYATARDSVDFIKKYIFPGSCIPSVTALLQAATRASELRLIHFEDLTPHYATTLRQWRENFLKQREAVVSLGFDEKFLRMWEFYLSLCEGSFAARYIGDAQLLLSGPLNRREPLLPNLPKPG